jgi:hypothetical protein
VPLTWDEDKNAWAGGPAIAPADVAVAAPTKAEFDALVAKFNALLVAARDAGLIALD